MLGDDADEQVVRRGYPIACPEDRDLKWTLRPDVNIDPSDFSLMEGGLTTASELDAVVLLSEISTRKVGDQDEKLEDDLGAVVAKVRDGASPDSDGVGPKVVEPKTQEPSDEPPADKSLLIEAGEIRRIFRTNDYRKEKWDAGIKKDVEGFD